ncbi:MAG: LPS export ABC transporter permease LptG [Moraxellaceae bacterium]|nr:LPS export ABC transporter permease LptG [Pseudomonadales bacterium]MCB1673661.1 LPS export ABC transporter permease LptG [Pseudomonadales bacterium]MCP5175277.1 LPS export ABC transporter permease LptG [Moraxellaceae bacterium]MCP5177022.1 LPS export ABC transporter permease LptG [Moraxellaceae bacterium]
MMSILSRYVAKTVFWAMLIVLFLLLGLDLVFSFLAELEDLHGQYQALQAMYYSALNLPFRFADIMPVAVLVGSIVGLGFLANNAELTVMRAAGLSVWRIVFWAMQPAFVLIIVGLLVSEYVLPMAQIKAETYKAQALQKHIPTGELWGYWQKQDDTFVQMHNVSPDGVLNGVTFYQFSPQGELLQKQTAQQGRYQAQGDWQLNEIALYQFQTQGTVTVTHQPSLRWQTSLNPEFLKLVTASPENLAPSRLYAYAHYIQQQGLVAAPYFLEFWKKILAPIATLSMVLVACSFIFGPLRSVTMGLRIITGILVGLGFRYLQDFLGYASLVYDFSSFLAAILPIGVSLLGGAWALQRVK